MLPVILRKLCKYFHGACGRDFGGAAIDTWHLGWNAKLLGWADPIDVSAEDRLTEFQRSTWSRGGSDTRGLDAGKVQAVLGEADLVQRTSAKNFHRRHTVLVREAASSRFRDLKEGGHGSLVHSVRQAHQKRDNADDSEDDVHFFGKG